MTLLDPGAKKTLKGGWSTPAWMTAAVLLVAAVLSAPAGGAATSLETVTYSPQTFNFQVSAQGVFSGDNNITLVISRREDSSRCRKIGDITVWHDPDPVVAVVHPGDYIVGRRVLEPPLCSFEEIRISGRPFQEEDINSICFDIPTRSMPGGQVPYGTPRFVPGRSSILEKELTVAFHLGPNQPFRTGVPRKKANLQANIQCVERPVIGRIEPDWGRTGTGQESGAAGSGTGTTAGPTPAPTAGSGFGGRQFTPVDPRTPPSVPTRDGSAVPEAVPRDPATVPRVPAGSATPQPRTTPREPGSRPAPTGGEGGAPQLSPACQLNGAWMLNENAYWNFVEVTNGIYNVTSGILEGTPLPSLPWDGGGGSSCMNPTAVLSGYTLRYFACGDDEAAFYEGTVNRSCNQVSGNYYNTSGQAGPMTLTRSRNLRVPVPNP